MLTRFCLNVFGRILPLGLALLTSVYVTETYWRAIAYSSAAVLFVVGEYFAVFRPLKHLYEKQQELLDEFTQVFVETAQIEKDKAKIRVNVMLVRWCFFRRHFFQFYQRGMRGHPDADIHFPISCGHCGEAFRSKQGRAHFVDLRGASDEELQKYGFSKRLRRATKDVKAIICVPLYVELKTFRGVNKTKWFGVLNVDALDDIGADLLREPKVHQRAEVLAEWATITLG